MKIIEFIKTHLNLELSRSTLAPMARGINFVGYRTWAGKRFIRRHSMGNFRVAMRNGKIESAISILGHAGQTHSLQHLLRYAKERHYADYRFLPEIYQRRDH